MFGAFNNAHRANERVRTEMHRMTIVRMRLLGVLKPRTTCFFFNVATLTRRVRDRPNRHRSWCCCCWAAVGRSAPLSFRWWWCWCCCCGTFLPTVCASVKDDVYTHTHALFLLFSFLQHRRLRLNFFFNIFVHWYNTRLVVVVVVMLMMISLTIHTQAHIYTHTHIHWFRVEKSNSTIADLHARLSVSRIVS